MTINQLNVFLINVLETHKRIIKPWKKRGKYYEDEYERDYENRYIEGWNDCVKEVQKYHTKYMVKFEKICADENREV